MVMVVVMVMVMMMVMIMGVVSMVMVVMMAAVIMMVVVMMINHNSNHLFKTLLCARHYTAILFYMCYVT
jgi:hypothetical protein